MIDAPFAEVKALLSSSTIRPSECSAISHSKLLVVVFQVLQKRSPSPSWDPTHWLRGTVLCFFRCLWGREDQKSDCPPPPRGQKLAVQTLFRVQSGVPSASSTDKEHSHQTTGVIQPSPKYLPSDQRSPQLGFLPAARSLSHCRAQTDRQPNLEGPKFLS